MRTGDTVLHRPTGETWIVATVNAERDEMSWMGWPEGWAKLSDCDLRESCSDDGHIAILRRLANIQNHCDHRRIYAIRELERLGWRRAMSDEQVELEWKGIVIERDLHGQWITIATDEYERMQAQIEDLQEDSESLATVYEPAVKACADVLGRLYIAWDDTNRDELDNIMGNDVYELLRKYHPDWGSDE